MPRDASGPTVRHPPSGPLDPQGDLVELTRLIGRTREVQELLELLASGRLITLTGAGGTGKTRLALEVAGRLREEGERAAWIELASLDDPALLPARILDGLGVRSAQSVPDVAEAASLLGTDPLVLVLDNCEHLVDACAGLVEGLLRAHPRLRILTTSREALGVRGERAWLVPPLSLPQRVRTVADVEGAESVELFVERARDARADFRLTDANAPAVAEICARLDGIPLAIELAAARVRVLTPEQIRDRLDDAFRLLSSGPRTAIPRHRTLEAAFQWSYDLLPPESRLLLERLSVFRGGFDLDEAEAVADGEILDGISRLVDRSLVHMREEGGSARYLLLETIRQFAAARLEESGEGERARRRHAEHLMVLAEAAAPHIFGGRGTPGWMERLEQDDANLRAAIEWALADGPEPGEAEAALDGDAVRPDDDSAGPGPHGPARNGSEAGPTRSEIGLRLATALLWYWFAQGRFAEGRAYLTRGLARGAAVPAPARARARVCLGHLAFWQGEHHMVGGPAREALAELEGTTDPFWRALALIALGMEAHLDERSDDAVPFLDEAVALVRPLAHSTLTVFALYWRGLAAQGRGDRAQARACLEEAGELGASSGDPAAASHPLTVLGRILLAEGDLARAREALGRGLAGHRESHDRWGMVLALEGMAGVAAAEGRMEEAVRILGGAEATRRAMDADPSPTDRVELDRTIGAANKTLGPDRVWELKDEGAGLGLEDLVRLARVVAGGAEPPAPVSASAVPTGVEAVDGAPTLLPDTQAAGITRLEAHRLDSHLLDTHRATGLRVRALGPLEVEMDGQLLDPEVWSYSRPRELLVYLLLKPRGGSRDEIGQSLWPESTPSQVKNSFHVTLHHLRKGLGRADRIILDGDRYRFARELPVSWDGGDFEEGLRGVLDAQRKGLPERDRLAALLSLYRGELLEGQAGARWLEEARDRFRRLRVDGHLLLGRILLNEGNLDGAGREYETVIQQEELNEEAHRGLMSAWARAGHRDRALRHYQRLAVILMEVLQAEPEGETRALHRRIEDGEVSVVRQGGWLSAT